MSTFVPTQWSLDPPTRPDQLSTAVVQSLSRPVTGDLAWPPLKSFILGGLSFGLLPLIAWPRKMRRFIVAEQQQLWHLVEWLRIRTGDPEAAKLRETVRQNGAVPTAWLVPLVAIVILVAGFSPWISKPWISWDGFLLTNYNFANLPSRAPFFAGWYRAPGEPHTLFQFWNVMLCIAYASHWLHVREHASGMNRLVGQINTILTRNNIPPARIISVGLGIRPLWALIAILGVKFGAYWAIPAAMAGAIQWRYAYRTSVLIRGELAQRVRTLLEQQRPAMSLAIPQLAQITCTNKVCGKTSSVGAAFCSRCGSRLPTSPGHLK